MQQVSAARYGGNGPVGEILKALDQRGLQGGYSDGQSSGYVAALAFPANSGENGHCQH
jgi:hypothetical protein